MDGERAVENDGPRHTVPDEIMNSSTPLHCLERDIAERVHAKVKREIGEHGETSCEAEPPDRHLVAENVRIYHLASSPGSGRSTVPLAICVMEGPNVNPSMVAVGTRISPRPPHRSRRALLTHRAPPSGQTSCDERFSYARRLTRSHHSDRRGISAQCPNRGRLTAVPLG